MPWGEFLTWLAQGCIVLVVLFIAGAMIAGIRQGRHEKARDKEEDPFRYDMND